MLKTGIFVFEAKSLVVDKPSSLVSHLSNPITTPTGVAS